MENSEHLHWKNLRMQGLPTPDAEEEKTQRLQRESVPVKKILDIQETPIV